ncbi:hypothetical protein [Streptomyces collinus]
MSESPGEQWVQAWAQHAARARQPQGESVLPRCQTEVIQHADGHQR